MCKRVLVAAILMSVSVTSQESEAELLRRFNAAVTRADPAWHEESSLSRKDLGAFSSKKWRRGDTLLHLRHYPHETEDEATQRARRLAESSSVGFRAIKGYGDQAFLIDATVLSTVLIVQSGTTVLSINSQDRDTVLQFGTLFVREIEQARRDGLVR